MSRKHEFEKATVFDWHGTLTKSDRSDKPREHMLKKVKKADKKGDVVILTSDSDRSKVKNWLGSHDVEYDKLVSRPKGDKEPDYKVKERLLKDDVTSDYKVTKAFDDKKKNVKMFRREGIEAKEV